VSKLAGEYYMRSFAPEYGQETVTLRYINGFGPYQDPTSYYSGVLAAFSRRMLAGEQPTIFGGGEQSWDFTHIENDAHAKLLAAEASAEKITVEVMNAGTGSRTILNEAFAVMREPTGYSGDPIYGPPRAGQVRYSLADIRRAQELISCRQQFGFREGLELIAAWYRKSSLSSPGEYEESSTW
jgi:UDP-glucose 4-epimerase